MTHATTGHTGRTRATIDDHQDPEKGAVEQVLEVKIDVRLRLWQRCGNGTDGTWVKTT